MLPVAALATNALGPIADIATQAIGAALGGGKKEADPNEIG